MRAAAREAQGGCVSSVVAEAVHSDEALIEATGRGDRDAFLELYDRFSARLLGLIVTVTRSRTNADDVLQRVMLEVWQRHAARYRPVLGSVESWLMRLARSRAIDSMRSVISRRDAEIEAGASAGDSFAGLDDPGDSPEQRSLRAALRCLTHEEYQPVELAFVRGMSREQIAALTGLPVGTVKTRIRRALMRLREEMGIGAGASPAFGSVESEVRR